MTQRGLDWAEDLRAGDVASCRRIQQGCKRFKADLKRAGTDAFPYVLGGEASEHMCACGNRRKLMSIEAKDMGFDLKEAGTSGTIEGYASLFGEVDQGGDTVTAGAYPHPLFAIAASWESLYAVSRFSNIMVET